MSKSLLPRHPTIFVGCDPELFVYNPNHNHIVSGYGMISGTKEKPHKVRDGAVQVDGVSLEININPADTEKRFVSNIASVKKQLEAMITGYELRAVPVAQFDEIYFESLPEEAKVLGCDPDFNAWTGEPNMPPDMMRPMRTGAGHVHLGWTDYNMANLENDQHMADAVAVVRQLDYYIGIYTLLYDKDSLRREMYGRAGCFRLKPYGVEYRVPSNAWMRSPELQSWIFRAARKAWTDLATGKSIEAKYGQLAQEIINEGMADWQEWADDLHADINLATPKFEDYVDAA